MAGEGSRFARAGWTTPKPLIQLHGVPLFQRAIGSVSIEGVDMKYSLIVRQEHIDNQHIDELIKEFLPEARIFSVLKTTRGAVETCLVAEEAIDDEDAVVVMACDLEFRSKRYNELVSAALSVCADDADGGALVSFESDNPRYSYALIDEEGRVVRLASMEEYYSYGTPEELLRYGGEASPNS